MRQNYGRIITTPESIVRRHRAEVLRLESKKPGPILGRRPPRIPWHQKINWDFAARAAGVGCGITLGLIVIYATIWIVIPFLRMIRWQ
jgi:hypothetical protein